MGRQSKEKPQGKLIIRKKRINAKGEVPIYVSYFIKGKIIERSTDMFIPPTQWDEKGQKVVGHKDSPRLNNMYLMALGNYGRPAVELPK